MKRWILAIFLAGALILSLAACGGGTEGGASPDSGSGGSGQTDVSAPDAPSASDDPAVPGGSQPGGPIMPVPLPDGSGPDAPEPDSGDGGNVSEPAGADLKLTLNSTSVELNKAGATFKLRYTVDPDIYDGVAVFTSSDAKVASVDESGTIKAVAPGKATITVKYDSAVATASVSCNWKVSQPAPAEPESADPADGRPGAPSVVPPGDPTAPDGEPPASAEKPPAPTDEPTAPDDAPTPDSDAASSANVDLSAFYNAINAKYTFPSPMLADDGILDMFYAGMTGIRTEQRLISVCAISMNNGEFGLVQVTDGADVEAVKNIFRARINYMVGDGNGPGGAQYPAAMDQWENNSRVVSNGNYVMMVVHGSCDDIVKEFNALF